MCSSDLQIAPAQIAQLRITYWGKLVDLDANAVTRSIERGFLRRISGEEVNFVNAPVVLERLGIRAEVVKSTDDCGYTELIQVEAVAPDGNVLHIKGISLGNWLMPEGYMFKFEVAKAPRQIYGAFERLLGRDKATAFWKEIGRAHV